MERLQFKITIDAPKEKVWNTLWNDTTYQEWTAVFSPGSRAETDWENGSKVLFVNAEKSGMVSMIADNVPNEFMSIRHLGIIKNGVEELDSKESAKWAGAMENYTLQDVEGGTELTVDMSVKGISPQFVDYFSKIWPKALTRLRELAETT
ncbi:MAG: Activator of Hsp90 ATPase 1 family protein [Flavipsychrobacter sp.]|nr:Activator of Hsp90 ATPase 1 family protein [Flavipsychrobacter sp.]